MKWQDITPGRYIANVPSFKGRGKRTVVRLNTVAQVEGYCKVVETTENGEKSHVIHFNNLEERID